MTESFTWHEVTEEGKEKIKNDAKKLLNEFASKLSKIKASAGHLAPNTKGYTEQCENASGIRKEGDGWDTDLEFRDLMFLNAPFVEDDSIIAEKGGWKK